jgi:hypothetical protein
MSYGTAQEKLKRSLVAAIADGTQGRPFSFGVAMARVFEQSRLERSAAAQPWSLVRRSLRGGPSSKICHRNCHRTDQNAPKSGTTDRFRHREESQQNQPK